ncbi:hypothetical protein PJWF_00064 [Achromobacter phage JWF]|uniref:hypothetical protein n=1 Tax=Achromobacter phage JWF TaxID=1589748 RepID=UPI000588E112|nr:hypothetical protein AXJ13_gp064 [Achromobacter phage JWF]AJD82958.1 hypothetical protein PJWF_00064 [Achromobacter phage JWF]
MKKTPRPHQIVDLAFYIQTRRCLNLSDPGAQKTGSAAMYSWYLASEKNTKSVWAMPKSLLRKNKVDLLEFSHFRDEEVLILDGTPAQREQMLLRREPKVLLMGFDRWSSDWENILHHHPQIGHLTVDEMHLGYAGHDSGRTQALYDSMKEVDTFLGMTGTIIKGRLTSAYPALNIIEPRFYGTYGAFLGYHAVRDDGGKITGWRNHEKLRQIFMNVAVRHTFEEVHGPESKVIIPELCDMSPAQRKVYDSMEADALVELEDSFLSAGSPGTSAIRCRQLMAHPETFGLKVGTTGKDERLKIHLGNAVQSGEPIAVFASLIPEQLRIVELAKSLGLRTGLINGTVSAARRAEIDAQFQAGLLDCVVASPATAGIGFNWNHLRVMVFASLDYQDDSFMQAYRRGIRGKRETPLLIYVLEYRDSIDQRIMKIIEMKSRESHLVDPTKEIYKLSQQNLDEEAIEGGIYDVNKIADRKASMAVFMEAS